MLFDAVDEQFGIYRGFVRHEGSAEASAESGLRLFDTYLSSCQFGGKAHHKVVYNLVLAQYLLEVATRQKHLLLAIRLFEDAGLWLQPPHEGCTTVDRRYGLFSVIEASLRLRSWGWVSAKSW